MFLMIGATINMLIMLVGVARRSYLVLALPVVVGTGIVSALAFWVGWTITNTEEDLAELESADRIPTPV
jgi:hypothetical protein